MQRRSFNPTEHVGEISRRCAYYPRDISKRDAIWKFRFEVFLCLANQASGGVAAGVPSARMALECGSEERNDKLIGIHGLSVWQSGRPVEEARSEILQKRTRASRASLEDWMAEQPV